MIEPERRASGARDVADGAMELARLEACVRGFGRTQIQVTGGCMRPVLPAGTRVGLQTACLRPPRLGDIVLVRTKDGVRLHRVVWKLPFRRSLRTKGDQAARWDPPVEPCDVMATVVSSDSEIAPGNGRWWRTFRSLARLLHARVRRALAAEGTSGPVQAENRPGGGPFRATSRFYLWTIDQFFYRK